MESQLNRNTRFVPIITTSNKNSKTVFVDGATIE